MGVQSDEAPGGDDDERKVEQLKSEVESGSGLATNSPLESFAYLAQLECGCQVSGTSMALRVRIGSHGEWCETHGVFSKYVDYVSARPLEV